MEYSPLVSVIVPVYNMEQYLGETLDSVLASDYPSFEVVVMNDGSKDASLEIAKEYARKDSRVKVHTQPNAGACAARNHAITLAEGELILPFDADDKMCPDFISDAVKAIVADAEVKVVCPKAEFFDGRKGNWNLAPFSLNLLARKNMIPICSLYYKRDWERVGGYAEEITAREDWAFWIAVLKDGGKVVTLPRLSMYYRVRGGSKRVTDRLQKKKVIDYLNRSYPEFFERELGGPLRYKRTWSKLTNRIYRIFHPRVVFINEVYKELSDFVKVLPVHFKNGDGEVIYKGRNELREFNCKGFDLVVKSFRKPNLVNQIVYGLFRSSKAERSYEYANMLLKSGIGSPCPVAYYTERAGLFFIRSYYVSLKSECPYTYYDLMKNNFPGQEQVLRAIARTTAALHEHGYLHKDYSRGNILFRETDGGVKVEIIDLNRIRFMEIGMEVGCKNFERLPGTQEMFAVLADEYAKVRGFDFCKCFQLMRLYAGIKE
ncbi:glycosyltransferase, group 2 family protein [Parabacteroides johnsonii DSM 18315]|jgi:glycosyltransferase involved in cell wall biosynthesis|uniref:Glycosyltransferase, group 2 family protein n=1 Tax=Parabacteroides johnsonii DSM 18315 TaxID=537006 RepID=B7B6Y8_9BACT|nr:glycosyltransferase [Parabacteroides johnsonii]EEC97819.1 glycosyltransferase, group 2 family protein [Parabacteroides johnsonii DSM 18315]UEA90288.1 glycosyltransferase [Parabacteroides johnsonii]UWP42451.1 glycosyltransferase [Parabacteroides johnsonii DSM 18315]HJG98002.1 glycosyltransferase [Parabacteroides johnsonii]